MQTFISDDAGNMLLTCFHKCSVEEWSGATPLTAPKLAASPTEDCVQVSLADVQDSLHCDTEETYNKITPSYTSAKTKQLHLHCIVIVLYYTVLYCIAEFF